MRKLIVKFFIKFNFIYFKISDDIWKQPKSPGGVSVPSTLSGELQATLTTKIQIQLATYKVIETRPDIQSDVFNWWKVHGPQFPDLVIVARKLHSIPATSVSSERLFSKAGLIFANKLRNRFYFNIETLI